MTLLEDAEVAIQSIEDSAQVQSDVISGDLKTVVPSPAGGIRSVANAINVMSQTNPTGAWMTATDFLIKDLVVEAGIIYIAVIPHTSGVFLTDLAANKWVIHQGLGIGVTPWASYPIDATLGGAFPNSTDVNFFFKRLDDELLIRGGIIAGTSPAASRIDVFLPSGFTIDLTKLPAEFFTTGIVLNNYVGLFRGRDGATLLSGSVVVDQDTPRTDRVFISNGDDITFGVEIDGNDFSSLAKIMFDFRVPIL